MYGSHQSSIEKNPIKKQLSPVSQNRLSNNEGEEWDLDASASDNESYEIETDGSQTD